MLNLNNKILTKSIALILAQVFLLTGVVYPEYSSNRNTSSIYIHDRALRVPLDSSNGYNRVQDVLNAETGHKPISREEEIADVVFKNISRDVETLRDPNQLCGWIAYFNFSLKRIDPYKILEVMLEKIGQRQYTDTYKEALRIKIFIAEGNRKKGLKMLPSEYLTEDWRVINTEGLESLISSFRPFDKPQTIEPSSVELGSLVHGAGHVTNEGELYDLREAVETVNGYVKEGRIMGSGKISSPFIAHGAEIQAGESKEISLGERNFRIEVFDDKIIIESKEKDLVAFYVAAGALFKDWEPMWMYMTKGLSGILEIGGIEYSFYTKDRSIILKPFHEIMLIHRSVARNLMVYNEFGQIGKAKAGEYRIPYDAFRDLLHYPSPDEIPELMNRYFEWLRREEEKIANKSPTAMHPVELAAQVFCRLMWVHPFENGNTRTAFLAMNYILMKNNYPPFVLTESNQAEFFKVLRFMHVPFKLDALGGKFIPVIDSPKIFSFIPKDFTAFLASQIKQMSILEARLEAAINRAGALRQADSIRASL